MAEAKKESPQRMPNQAALFFAKNGRVCEGAEHQKPFLEKEGWEQVSENEADELRKKEPKEDPAVIGKFPGVPMVDRDGTVHAVLESEVSAKKRLGWLTLDEANEQVEKAKAAAQKRLSDANAAAKAANEEAAAAEKAAAQSASGGNVKPPKNGQ